MMPPGRLGKLGPVGAELELHRDARHHAHPEVDGEDLSPEPRTAIVVLIPRTDRQSL